MVTISTKSIRDTGQALSRYLNPVTIFFAFPHHLIITSYQLSLINDLQKNKWDVPLEPELY